MHDVPLGCQLNDRPAVEQVAHETHEKVSVAACWFCIFSGSFFFERALAVGVFTEGVAFDHREIDGAEGVRK